MEEHEFSKLIEKYQREELSGAERKVLEDWFEKLGQDEVPHLWTTGDKSAVLQKILQRIRATEQVAHTRDVSGRKTDVDAISPTYARNVYRVAAAVLLVAISSFIVWRLADQQHPAAGVSQLSAVSGKVILSDGSIVWLQNDSELVFPEKFGKDKREVVLKGEALFEVAKDADRPFSITCGELTTTVLGTSFHIKSIDNDVEVVVLTGKVSVRPSTGGDHAALVLLPNEKAVYDGGSKQLAKLESIKEERTALLGRTEYEMHFEDARMSEIIQRIERKFDITVIVEDQTVNNCMITADFTDQSLDRTLTMIAQALGLQYMIAEAGEVVLSGSGCQSR